MDPAGPPPSYDAATAASESHKSRNGIPPQSRRSMEDEARELPHGWVRQYDPKTHHQFFVDTNTDALRSIWHHPYDDEQYMNSLAPEERARITGMHRVPSAADMAAESTDEEDHHALPKREEAPPTGLHKLGRRMKDKLTSSTHEERERQRARRAEHERKLYEQHQLIRRAMSKAMETGQPQLVGTDKDGKDVYIEPPTGYGPNGGYGGGGYGQNAYGINPYSQGPYTNPNARFISPQSPYQRPNGYGYGGGYGMPLGMMGMGLGMGGGLMLGGLF
ncbi:MAG: hypothetical protein M1818_007786 [Claussenomyces sp. TS43310]|nr:MAG: hypothetical protein M1818_007786 [Claussenomyces sp. TS43310]